MPYTSQDVFDWRADNLQFKKWSEEQPPDADFLAHLKHAAGVALSEELTDIQKAYFAMYLQGHNVSEIAQAFGVNKSTASRGLTRAKKRLAKVLRYAAPHMMQKQAETRNRRQT